MARKNAPNHGSLKKGYKGRYYYNFIPPGETKLVSRALRAPGHDHSTKDRRMAIVLANEMWDELAERVEQYGHYESLPHEMTLKDYTDKFIEMRTHELSKATIENYQISIRYALEYFGKDRRINMITPLMAQEFKTALASGNLQDAMEIKKDLNRTSVNIHMKQIRAVMNFAVTKLKILPKNPFSGLVDTVKLSIRWHYVTPDELQRTLEAATSNYRCLIALCRLAGLRRFEAYHLQWQDVNFETGTIYVVGDAKWQPKDRQDRTVPMCPELQTVLLKEFEQASERTDRICSLDYSGNIGRDVKATIKRAGLTPWSKPLHTLRKSCLTDWANKYPIHAVKEWAGHEDIATTQQYYLQVSPDTYIQAATRSLFATNTPAPKTVGA